LIAATLAPFVGGYQMGYMSPVDFIRNPLLWMRLVSREKAHFTLAPDFAYRLCALRWRGVSSTIPVELSGLLVLQSGGEPVRASTISAFEEAFASVGLRQDGCFVPTYGLAEHVV
ncbi:unnamed protein product, partial [Discosporangium mesarthrocarpum]